jgi:hypothetical protein
LDFSRDDSPAVEVTWQDPIGDENEPKGSGEDSEPCAGEFDLIEARGFHRVGSYGSVRGFEVALIACFGVSIDVLPGFSYSYSALAVLVLVLEDTVSSTIKVKTSQLQKSEAGVVNGLSITIP